MHIAPVDNIVRWRRAENPSKENKLDHDTADQMIQLNDIDPQNFKDNCHVESNARLIEWSDGTFSFAIGDELFDVRQEDLHNSSIFVKCDSELALLKSAIHDKIYVKPSHKSTRHVQMFTQKLKDEKE